MRTGVPPLLEWPRIIHTLKTIGVAAGNEYFWCEFWIPPAKATKEIINATKAVAFEGYIDNQGMDAYMKYLYQDINIYRAPRIPRGSGSNLRLSLNYISFVFGAVFKSLFFLRAKTCPHVS